MLTLILNEWTKVWNKKQSWLFVGIIIVLSIGASLMYNSFSQGEVEERENWEATLQEEIATQEEILASDDEEEWAQDYAMQVIDENEQLLEAGINPYESNNAIFLNETILLVTSFVTLFSVVLASTIVSSEQDKGTLKHLFIQPFERWQFLFAKFVTVVGFMIILLITAILSVYLMGTIVAGTGSFSTPILEYGMGGSIITTVSEVFPMKMGLYFLNTLMFIIIAFTLSILFKSQTLAVGISIFVLFGTNIMQGFSMMLQDYLWYKLFFLPHLSLTTYVTADELMPGVGIGFSLAVLAVYAFILIGAATAFFQKRDLA
ncbi:ABC transporter permease subunit [Alteribacter aurantiacus]|uniref:ABC transporter permease subunit n=1 Tax=Alteribacter aurantiacus TaxID=254410 RepID=UPI0003FB5ECC|nr:ABC transporter permease subunit [Alteribacter aurantiacus]